MTAEGHQGYRGDGTEGGKEGKGEGGDEILADGRTHCSMKGSTRGLEKVKAEPTKHQHQDFFSTELKAASSHLKCKILQAKLGRLGRG